MLCCEREAGDVANGAGAAGAAPSPHTHCGPPLWWRCGAADERARAVRGCLRRCSAHAARHRDGGGGGPIWAETASCWLELLCCAEEWNLGRWTAADNVELEVEVEAQPGSEIENRRSRLPRFFAGTGWLHVANGLVWCLTVVRAVQARNTPGCLLLGTTIQRSIRRTNTRRSTHSARRSLCCHCM